MILAVDTSTMTCRTTLIDDDARIEDVWEVGRQLADQLIGHERALLAQHKKTWSDLSAIIVFKGPGSFTGLRIGLTVMNMIAETLDIPIIGETGDAWREVGQERLKAGQDDKLIMPVYGREATITKPRK